MPTMACWNDIAAEANLDPGKIVLQWTKVIPDRWLPGSWAKVQVSVLVRSLLKVNRPSGPTSGNH